MKLLLIEDDLPTAGYVCQGLVELGHACDLASTGLDGLTAGLTKDYDAIILDRNLPLMDGLSVLEVLRAQGHKTPVLILSALGQVDDRIRGLNAGGDDYLTKPFSFQELVARLAAIVRRVEGVATPPRTRHIADLELDLLTRVARRGERRIELSNKEFQLLDYFLRHVGQVITRTMLIEAAWDYSFDPGTNLVDVHISRLRAKLDGDGEAPLLHTVRGAGYRLDAN
jgi:two-component system OmpR family response regulator